MCTWFYADHKALENYITRAQRSPLAREIMLTMSRSTAMTRDIRPTDVAAGIASGRSGNMGVFPMVWGFTSEASSKPIINCRIETAEQKSLWQDSWRTRRCVIPASWYYEWGVSPTAEGYNTLRQQRVSCRQDDREFAFWISLHTCLVLIGPPDSYHFNYLN